MHDQNFKFEDGEAYEQTMGIWSQLVGFKFLQWLSPSINQRWIDVGCGNGAFTEQMVKNYKPSEVQGIDPSDDQIYFAKNRPGVQTATFQIGDAMALPFESDQFDFATMALVIRFVPDPAQGVAEMKRVVRPGGAVAAYVWDSLGGGMPHEPIQAELRSMNIKYPRPPSAEASRLDILQKLWVDAGLRSVETRIITVERTFSSFENFWSLSSLSRTLQPVLEDLDPATLNQLKSSIQARLTAEENGEITCAAHVNAIKGLV